MATTTRKYQDYQKAIQWYTVAAKGGYSMAYYRLGLMHELGKGVDASMDDAALLYKTGASLGNVTCMAQIAWCHRHGNGVELSLEQAFYWYKKAAENGDETAQYELARMYNEGAYVEFNFQECLKWYLSASTKLAEAKDAIGLLYFNGLSGSRDYQTAEKWFSEAAKQKYHPSLYHLGLLYEEQGKFDDSVKYYEEACQLGSAAAYHNLARLYCNGIGVEIDFEKALRYYSIAAEKGIAASFYSLGILYLKGKGVDKDISRAVELLSIAADKKSPEAQHQLGMMYSSNDIEEIEIDYDKAVKYYQMGVDQNYSLAQNNLGLLYEKGNGVPFDISKALMLFRKAAEQKLPEGMYNMGRIYENGCLDVIQPNHQIAVEWYEMAADIGHSISQFRLGRLYLDGFTVTTSTDKAKKFLS